MRGKYPRYKYSIFRKGEFCVTVYSLSELYEVTGGSRSTIKPSKEFKYMLYTIKRECITYKVKCNKSFEFRINKITI